MMNTETQRINSLFYKKGFKFITPLSCFVVDKDGNFKEMYSGYAGDVIKDDNYFEVITE